MWAGFWSGAVIYAAAWFQGGRVERFAAAVLIVNCALMVMTFVLIRDAGVMYLAAKVANGVCLLIFGWLCFRSDRWWPFLAITAMGLAAVTDIVALFSPHISQWGATSAKIGLGYLTDLSLLLGVYERRLAGEEPAGRPAWARADMATSARRDRNRRTRRLFAGRRGERAEALP